MQPWNLPGGICARLSMFNDYKVTWISAQLVVPESMMRAKEQSYFNLYASLDLSLAARRVGLEHRNPNCTVLSYADICSARGRAHTPNTKQDGENEWIPRLGN